MSNTAGIKARLLNLARQEQKPYDYILTHYFIERLLFRLSKSRYADGFVLKGGLLLHVLLSDRARATRDIDLLACRMPNTPEALMNVFRDVAAFPADDGVTFDGDSMVSERITENADYQGVRLKLIGYLDRTRGTLQFDIGFGDVVVPKPAEMVYPSLLGMEEIQLMAYSKESIIAEKFQAMLYLANANSRMKDFYDIAMLASSFDFDGRILLEAVSQTIERRATALSAKPVVFTTAFAQDEEKQTQWRNFSRRTLNSHLTFDEALSLLDRFLQPIYNTILAESEFSDNWRHESLCWCKPSDI